MTETAAADAVRYEADGPVARIALNRPGKLNAINGQRTASAVMVAPSAGVEPPSVRDNGFRFS